MSKKFGKFLLFSAVAGAAAYGTYYYLKKKDSTPASENAEDADDDFDDFSEDLDEDVAAPKERSYVSLNLDKAEAFASEAFHKAKEVIADSVQQMKETVKAVTEGQSVSGDSFTDLTALNREKNQAEEAASDEAASPAEETPKPDSPEKVQTASGSTVSEDAGSSEPSEKVEDFFDEDDDDL